MTAAVAHAALSWPTVSMNVALAAERSGDVVTCLLTIQIIVPTIVEGEEALGVCHMEIGWTS